jgi:Secretion system C-terminal sorting domain
MKRRTLLLFVMTSFITVLHAQKKQKPVTGYAITAIEKGGRSWKEVRLVDIGTGEEVKTIYQSTQESQPLNARTGKPIVKKEPVTDNRVFATATTDINTNTNTNTNTITTIKRKVINLDMELDKAVNKNVQSYTIDENSRLQPLKIEGGDHVEIRSNSAPRSNIIIVKAARFTREQTDKPFATNSAACAYDKKHDRLYYTPMGISQLRYIDLKSNKIYYFEDEPFGVVKGSYDSPNQITRMVIASDGDGYALTNDGNHLLRFTTGKKPTITDLGALTDETDTKLSVHSTGGGGDMVADASDNLYLISANRSVFKISIETKVATYLGNIKGLPRGFSTNGAMVEEGSKVIIASSESTVGYYRFDLTTLLAEKVSASGNVFNASDLANGNLAFSKKKKKDKDPEVVKEEPKPELTEEAASRRAPSQESLHNNGITVYPNPVTNGFFKLSFADQPAGKYQVQVIDLSGKLISSREVTVNNKIQVEEFRLPELLAGGNYMVKVVSEPNNISVVNKLVIQ